MKKIIAMLAGAAVGVVTAYAGMNIQWYVGYGVYPFGAPDPTSTTPGTGLLSNNGNQPVTWQLVYSPDNVIDDVNPANSGGGYVGGNDVVLESRTWDDNSPSGTDEWMFNNTIPAPYVNATFSAGFVYIRVFQDSTPQIGDKYYDTAMIATADRGSDITQTQTITVGTDSLGVALNKTIVPEPATFAFIGIGGLLLAIRRMRRS